MALVSDALFNQSSVTASDPGMHCSSLAGSGKRWVVSPRPAPPHPAPSQPASLFEESPGRGHLENEGRGRRYPSPGFPMACSEHQEEKTYPEEGQQSRCSHAGQVQSTLATTSIIFKARSTVTSYTVDAGSVKSWREYFPGDQGSLRSSRWGQRTEASRGDPTSRQGRAGGDS